MNRIYIKWWTENGMKNGLGWFGKRAWIRGVEACFVGCSPIFSCMYLLSVYKFSRIYKQMYMATTIKLHY